MGTSMQKTSTNIIDGAGVLGAVTWMASYLTAATSVLTVLIGIATLIWAVFRAWNEISVWRKRNAKVAG